MSPRNLRQRYHGIAIDKHRSPLRSNLELKFDLSATRIKTRERCELCTDHREDLPVNRAVAFHQRRHPQRGGGVCSFSKHVRKRTKIKGYRDGGMKTVLSVKAVLKSMFGTRKQRSYG